jgi:hypothetical protein
MSNGIAHNNLNDISKIYLDTISDINKKEQSDDVKRWQQEESECGQNTRQQSPFKKKKVKAYKEAFSNWRTDLREVTSDAEATEIDDQPEIKEKKVKNKIKINPEFKEAVKQMGGELLEVKEVDSPDGETDDKLADKKKEQDDAKAKKISDKERKLKMRILRVKMMATKQDAGASIVAGYEPKVNAIKKLVNERLGGKGYSRKATKGGGDWPDSDRGEGNKAKRRAGGKVEKKSPTYLAHVHNKEEVEVQEKVLDKFETGEKERIVKGMKKDKKGLQKRYGDKWKNVMYATATKKAKEAGDTSKSDKRYAHEGYQRDPEQSKKDRTHSKQPDPSKDGFTGIGNMSIKDIMKMNAKMKKEKKKEVKEDKALAAVKASIIKKHGKGAIYDPKKKQSSADKAKVSAERKKRQDADNKAYAARAKKAGFKSTQDYTDVVARYGSEDNYKKGKGLGT